MRASRNPTAAFVLDALEQALHARRPTDSLSPHGDRGSQYVSIRCAERLAEAGIDPSVGSVGDSHDNALAESVIGLFKTEVIHRLGPWRSFEAVEFATLEWVDWFNHQRLLEPIGNIPPAEAEANTTRALENLRMAASDSGNRASGNPRVVQMRFSPDTKSTSGVVGGRPAMWSILRKNQAPRRLARRSISAIHASRGP